MSKHEHAVESLIYFWSLREEARQEPQSDKNQECPYQARSRRKSGHQPDTNSGASSHFYL